MGKQFGDMISPSMWHHPERHKSLSVKDEKEYAAKERNMRFRKKPVVIEAVQWKGDNLAEVIRFTGLHESALGWTWDQYEAVIAREGLKVFTLEGPLFASVGDWIIRGVKGEFYPCKPDIFAATYEPVD